MYEAMRDELFKIAEISTREAVESLKKLKELEEAKPDPSAIARGALAGGLAGTASTAARGITTGDIFKGVGKALKEPTVARKAGKILGGAAKGVGGALAGSAAFGATLPFARRYLDREAEKAKLRDYLGVSSRGKVRREVAKTLGVG